MQMLYITFIDFDDYSSGSSVRPHMMYDAFLDLGIDVKLLEGQHNRRKERRSKVREILDWLNNNTPDFCYVEPPSGPFFNYIDLILLKKLREKGVPIGLFFRDLHWLYPEFGGGYGSKIKRTIIGAMHRRDLRCFRKCCDIVYTPGEKTGEILRNLGMKKVKSLPPGGAISPMTDDNFSLKNYIYLGGTSYEYGGLRLLDAFKRINKEETKANLIFIVNKDDEVDLTEYEYPWLKIVHTFNRNEIEAYYGQATYAMIPFRRVAYMDLAVPIKLFEYIGYGIPVISTDCEEISRILSFFNCGILSDDSIEGMAKVVESTLSDQELYKRLKGNTVKASKENKWLDRAARVVADLT